MATALDPRTARAKAGAATVIEPAPLRLADLAAYVAVGVFLGVVMVKSEVIFWYRINEMFRFQSFHMYGMLGSALATAFVSLQLLTHFGARARTGDKIALAPKELGSGRRYWIGGSVFGAGWALCGACPGPLFALIASGHTAFAVTGIAALAGTWTYGYLRPRLPH